MDPVPDNGGDRPMELARTLIGQSAAMRRVRELLEKAAATDVTILLTGPTGSGKEVAARMVRYLSRRRKGPFVPVNCGALPPELLESELFGHEKGAFTGALTRRAGRFELAHQGTLFLDEVGDMPAAMQVRMLRVLQERVVDRVGGCEPVRVDVRLVAAAQHDLAALCEQGRFRPDLYYRLNLFPIAMPALAERREDIPLLVAELERRARATFGFGIGLTAGAIDLLCENDWPGNVRELANVIERLAVLFPDEVADADKVQACLGRRSRSDANERAPRVNLKDEVAQLEARLIRGALAACDGVVELAAQRLGLRRTTLVEKIKRLRDAGLLPAGGHHVADDDDAGLAVGVAS